MLVLSRKPDESIIIGDNIIIQILSSRGNHIRLGITAPTDISVHREKIYKLIKAKARKQPISKKQGEQ
ncbi:MAG: carbon storage regulator CsrA [Gammaproteobacteria bacterium]